MTTRLPGQPRAVKPPSAKLGTIAPPVRCPSGKPRYRSIDTATAHYRVSAGGAVVVACERCGGWHHERRRP